MDEPALDVVACLERVRKGDEDAARELLTHLHPLVVKIVRAHLPRRTLEEDLVQTVFVKVFTKLDQYQGRVPLQHWVSRIAVNTCYNELSRERVRPEIRHADLSEDEVAVLQNVVGDSQEPSVDERISSREIVEKLLSSLNPSDRLVVTWLHMEGRSVDEIRQLTGWSATLVKVRAFRARQKLRKLMAQWTKGPPSQIHGRF